jgi:phenylalanyl-tRNA synthetase beta chain
MKISYDWLQKYFDTPLPSVAELSDAITFHAFEIDGIDPIREPSASNGAGQIIDHVLDVKVLPDRTHDCLSYRGVAKEVSAILNIPLASDPLEDVPKLAPVSQEVTVGIEDGSLCPRYIAGHIKGVKVGPSPDWLVRRLASMGQRSVNNVVDATNFVMFNMGQPLHAFDAGKLTHNERPATNDKAYSIAVRKAKPGEKMLALDGKEYAFTKEMLVIADVHADAAVGIAGIKGGMPAGVTEDTTDIIIESANFNGVSVRKTAKALNLRTDASVRFENVISPELAAYGMHAAVTLIQKLAGGTIEGFTDVYKTPAEASSISVSTGDVNRIFGTSMNDEDVESVIKRFGWTYDRNGASFTVSVPFERLDMTIPEDVAADIGRIYGYDHVPAVVPEPTAAEPAVNKRFYYIDRIRDYLARQGFSEVYTSVFVKDGARQVLNKVDSDTPYLRAEVWPNLAQALERNWNNRDLLGLPDVRLFEIGTVWSKDGEKMALALGIKGGKGTPPASEFLAGLIKELDGRVPEAIPATPVVSMDLDSFIANAPDPLSYKDLPIVGAARYQPFSRYPFIVRDVAFWTPAGTTPEKPFEMIGTAAGILAVHVAMFDRFEKPASQGGEGKVSYGFRIVFQATDRTLTDAEANQAMEKVYEALKKEGYEIR